VAEGILRVGGHDIKVTHGDRVVFPDDGVTKGDVARHYARVATRLLPFTVDRPLTVERCPDGLRGRCFYQKNFAMAAKLGVPTAAIHATCFSTMPRTF